MYTTKFDPQRNTTRYKGRLVVLENRQKERIDYSETFAPLAKLKSVRALSAMAAIHAWHTHEMYVKNVFLYIELEETV